MNIIEKIKFRIRWELFGKWEAMAWIMFFLILELLRRDLDDSEKGELTT